MEMKYLLVLLALGAVICNTYAAPAGADIQQENGNSKDEEFLDMLSRVTKATQQKSDDDYDDADGTPAEAQWGFFKKLFRKVRRSKLLRRYGGRVLGHVVKKYYMNQRDNKDEENALIEAALNSKLESIAGDDDDGGDDVGAIQNDLDDDNSSAEAQWGFFKKIFRKVRRSKLLRRYGGRVLGHAIRYYMNQRDNKDEENALIEAALNSKPESIAGDDDDGGDDVGAIQNDLDDDNSSAEAQWGFFKKLFRKVRRSRLLRRYGGRVLGHVVKKYYNQRDNKGEENALIEAALNSKLESIAGDDDDGDDDVGAIQNDLDDDNSSAEAQWGFFKKLFRKVRRSRLLRRYGGRVLGHVVKKYYMNQRDNKDEENALIEAALNSKLESIAGDDDDGGDDVGAIQNDLDDDNSSAEAQWGFFKRFIRRFLRKKYFKKLAKKVLDGVVRSHMNPHPQQGNGGGELESIAAEEQGDGYSDGDDDGKIIQSDEDDDDSPHIADATENDTALAQAFLEKLLEKDTNNMIVAAIESLPEEAQAQFLSSV